jgi:hypothetical protein
MKVKNLIEILLKTNPDIDVVISGDWATDIFEIEEGYIFVDEQSKTRTCGEVAKKEIIESRQKELERNIEDYTQIKIDKERKKIDEFEKNMKKCLVIFVR